MKSDITRRFTLSSAAVVGLMALVMSTASAQDVYKLGGNLSLTGTGAFYGNVMREGIDLAVSEVNAAGKGFKLETVYEDHKFNPREVASGMNKLTTVDKVLAVFVNGSTPTLTSAPIADRTKVILVNGGGVSPSLVGAGKYLLNIIPNGTVEVEAITKYLRNDLKATRLGIIYSNDDFGNAMKDATTKELAKLGGGVVSAIGYDPKAIDFSSHVAKLKDAQPDAVYLLSTAQEGGVVLKQARELGLSVPFVSYSAFQNPELLSKAGSAANGVRFTSLLLDYESTSPRIQNFVKSYQSRYGKMPELYAGTYYDGVHMIATAIEHLKKAGKPVTGESVLAALYETKEFDGATGKITLRSDGTVKKPLSLKAVRDGQFVTEKALFE